jgi:hypothetical protein
MLWVSSYLYGPWKGDFKSALVLQGDFSKGTEVIVNVRQVSTESTLTIKSGTKVVLTKKFVCGPDLGTDFTKVVKTEWGYQNISNRDFTTVLTESSSKLSFENTSGDWMLVNSITIKQGTLVYTYNLSDDTWGKKQSTYMIDETGAVKTLDGSDLLPFDIYRKNVAIAKQNKIAMMVQEFGVYNKTPHTVVVDFISDLSKFFKENNIGWALWNFNGSFGILNSDRTDCTYEPYQGYKLDRQLLNALNQSVNTSSNQIKTSGELKIFPSPASDAIYFSTSDFNGKTYFRIVDLAGRVLQTFSYELSYAENIRLDVSRLDSNVYFLQAVNNGKFYVGKFILKK